MKNSRRQCMILSVAGAFTSLLNDKIQAQPMVFEADPQAIKLGYKMDASKIDKLRYGTYVTGQRCNNCSFYQGKPGSGVGGCALFPGRQVAAPGWCLAYAK